MIWSEKFASVVSPSLGLQCSAIPAMADLGASPAVVPYTFFIIFFDKKIPADDTSIIGEHFAKIFSLSKLNVPFPRTGHKSCYSFVFEPVCALLSTLLHNTICYISVCLASRFNTRVGLQNNSTYWKYSLLTWLMDDFYRATVHNAVHGIAVGILSVHPSVRPSVRQMHVLWQN